MKKGLKRLRQLGVKDPNSFIVGRIDLMKKGLKQLLFGWSEAALSLVGRIDLMKKGLKQSPAFSQFANTPPVGRIDLMKKGLKQS